MTAFLILFSVCWVASYLLVRWFVPDDFRARHRSSVFWGRISLFSLLMLLTGSWTRWNLQNWISGQVTKDVNVTESVVALLVISSVIAFIFFAAERR